MTDTPIDTFAARRAAIQASLTRASATLRAARAEIRNLRQQEDDLMAERYANDLDPTDADAVRQALADAELHLAAADKVEALFASLSPHLGTYTVVDSPVGLVPTAELAVPRHTEITDDLIAGVRAVTAVLAPSWPTGTNRPFVDHLATDDPYVVLTISERTYSRFGSYYLVVFPHRNAEILRHFNGQLTSVTGRVSLTEALTAIAARYWAPDHP